MEQALKSHSPLLRKVFESAKDYRFQVSVSEVTQEDENGSPCLLRHGFRVDHEYFYPASSIKLCAAVAALEKLESLQRRVANVSCTTPLKFHSLEDEGESEQADGTNLNSHSITIAHELRKLFLVSDNQAFNRLYDFVGHRRLNETMWKANLPSTRIRHRLSEDASPQSNNSLCRPIEQGEAAGFPPKRSHLQLPDNDAKSFLVGKGYINSNGELVEEPMDFSLKNCISLQDLQNLLIKITRPDLLEGDSQLNLDKGYQMLLKEAMSQYPGDSSNPCYDRESYPDDWCKFFLPGVCRVRSKGALRIYNKVGRGYGFSIDNAYIFDIETARSFFLAATIYTNANGILNDDMYEYDIADRVMADLAEAVARVVWKVPAELTSLVDLSTRLHCAAPSRLRYQGTKEGEESAAQTRKSPCGKRFQYFVDE